MSILKALPAEPKNETLQLRVSQDLKFRLLRYAEFIHANTSYVVTAALDRLFRKDAEFQKYLASYKSPESGDHSGGGKDLHQHPEFIRKIVHQIHSQNPSQNPS